MVERMKTCTVEEWVVDFEVMSSTQLSATKAST